MIVFEAGEMYQEFKYLFPFEKIKPDTKILIYGAGDMGHAYLKQVMMTGYCTCIGFLDRAYKQCSRAVVPVYPPEKVQNLAYDYIVIALKTKIHLRGVTALLESLGVKRNCLIYAGSRTAVATLADSTELADSYQYAFQQKETAIALRYGSALGDAIIAKKFYEAVVSFAPGCLADIYTPYGSKNIKAVYTGAEGIFNIIDDAGVLYEQNKSKYMMALSVTNLVRIDSFDTVKCEQVSAKFKNFVDNMSKKIQKYGLRLGEGCDRFLHYRRTAFLGQNCYTGYNQFSDYLNIQDTKVTIPLMPVSEVFELPPMPYVTVNYGNGSAKPGFDKVIAKQWPFDHVEVFVQLLKKQYPQLKVVQIGMKDAPKIADADVYCLGRSLETVKRVLQGAVLHVDSEGGLVHLATQLGTKCAVMFGPTPVSYFGYSQNINIVSPQCTGCYGLYEDINSCARKQGESDCMKAITPELVLQAVNSYLCQKLEK